VDTVNQSLGETEAINTHLKTADLMSDEHVQHLMNSLACSSPDFPLACGWVEHSIESHALSTASYNLRLVCLYQN